MKSSHYGAVAIEWQFLHQCRSIQRGIPKSDALVTPYGVDEANNALSRRQVIEVTEALREINPHASRRQGNGNLPMRADHHGQQRGATAVHSKDESGRKLSCGRCT